MPLTPYSSRWDFLLSVGEPGPGPHALSIVVKRVKSGLTRVWTLGEQLRTQRRPGLDRDAGAGPRRSS